MPASGIREGLRLSTIFTPYPYPSPGPVVVHKERNCSGTPGGSNAPIKIAMGQYRVFSPDHFVDNGGISITKHATNKQGQNRFVTVVTSLVGPAPQTTQVDVYIRDEAGNPTDDALFVEATIDAMPI